jgi:hypothetical protein
MEAQDEESYEGICRVHLLAKIGPLVYDQEAGSSILLTPATF